MADSNLPLASTTFQDKQCTTAIWNNYDTCGTITRADIGLANPTDLETIFKTGTESQLGVSGKRYRDMESLLVTNLELKACGGRQYGLYDWLMSSGKSMGGGVTKRSIAGAGVEIEPFIMASQKDTIKDDYWTVEKVFNHAYKYETNATGVSTSALSGSADTTLAAAPFSGIVSGNLVVRVLVNSDSNQSAAAAYFTKGASFFWFSKDSTGKSYKVQFRVKGDDDGLAAGTVVAKAGPSVSGAESIDIMCVPVSAFAANNAIGGTASADVTAADIVFGAAKVLSLLGSQGTGGQGVLVAGTNNVSDFESWCFNRPALNTNKHVPFWYQTSRYTLCVDQFYKEWLERMMRTNAYFQKFGDVSLADRNAQLGMRFQKEWVNSFFFGNKIGPNQTLANYKSLTPVTAHDPSESSLATGLEGSAIGYRANAVGVYRQLADCGRVVDKRALAFDLRSFIENDIFDIVRSRKDQNKPSDQVDVFTDSKTAKNIFTAMVKYYSIEGGGVESGGNVTGGALRLNMDITAKNIDSLGFYSNSYKLHYPAGVTLNVITNEFFDDMVSASKAADASSTAATDGSNGRYLMVLDLGGGIYPGIIGSNRVVHTTGALNELAKVNSDYACVMANPTKETTLNSLTWTAVVECPSDNLIIENFQDAAMSV